MPLRKRRRHQQPSEFERGHVKVLKGVFSFCNSTERLVIGMFPLCMIVGRSGLRKAQSQEKWGPTTHRSPLTEKAAVFAAWL
ncbi:hypothetical protein TNCV_4142981 [Trichonephila clavipes]|nr:hypothetical protein TNCV_4142981 [Trichonephila clavipes]